MQFEYAVLAILSIFFLLAFVPVSVAKLQSFGPRWLASNRTPLKDKELSKWGARCERAHNNLKDNFPGIVVAILLLGQQGKFDEVTKWTAGVYLVARLVHYTVYAIGHVPLRAFAYFTGLFANILLLVKALV